MRALRAGTAADVTAAARVDWDVAGLRGSSFCLLISYRRDGGAVATPMWFAIDGERIVLRSGGRDGKVKRIAREPRVLVASCDARGRPLGSPMAGTARVLDVAEARRAEAVLARTYGPGRRLYNLVRASWLELAWIEVTAGTDGRTGS